MKKITYTLFFALLLSIGMFTCFAQVENIVEYNDFQFDTNSGFTSFVSHNPNNVAVGTLIKRTANLPTDEVDAPGTSILGFIRPTNNIGHYTDVRTPKSIKLSGNSSTENYEGISWLVTQSVDISKLLEMSVCFASQNQYHEGADDEDFQVLIAFNYTDGADPSTATWIDVTANITNINGIYANDGNWAYSNLDLADHISTSGSDKFVLAFKYTYHNDGNPFSGTDNRNGNWNISDVKYSWSGYQETLENYTDPTNEWSTESYAGDNGFSWTIEAKTTTNRIGPTKELYMVADKTGLTSGTISGGIKSFAVSCKNIFTTTSANLELLINGNTVGTTSNTTNDEEYIFKVENIDITGDFTIGFRNADTSNGSVAFDNLMWATYSGVASTKSQEKISFSAYPNPVRNTLFIKTQQNTTIDTVQLIDLTGKIIYESAAVSSIDIQSIKSGLYILFLTTKNGISSSTKIVIE
ncbi:T9SS type A sorting domain-containing protein [Flavicella sp.]|uniref:T9SS type A sorting domain-containing protein n=1 Tax=Flavicella sp. TaxID=2957742 RepID=UPI00260D65C0|nr:T9SS type A sorting domain-containing protein [Flavicella sp.]MDG1803522.1 T9SS type A sorting domain-containing protein [Flavicella sp.]